MNQSFLRRFFHHRIATVALVLLILEVLAVIVLPGLLQLDPYTTDVAAMNKAPDAVHILGTDTVGRDIFARLVYGGRNSLFIGVMSTVISVLIGLPLGLIAGYYKGFISNLILRVADMFMSFPSMIIVLVVVALFGSSVASITVILGVLGWPAVARLLSANVLAEREKDYVLAARTIGTRSPVILVRYILPNAISPLWMSLAFRISQSMIMESGLSFLSAGVQPPEASWGNIMQSANSRVVLTGRPWIWVPAGLCLIVTIVCINFVGEGIRDALDPKLKRL
jgi:peptide/nickel transport system permease protein